MDLTLRLLRHGRTEWTDQGRYCGHADIPLSTAGRREIEALELPAAVYASVICSDLLRCRQTARAVGVTARAEPGLREFDFGQLEGRTWDELAPAVQASIADFDGFVAPGGESVAAFARRVDAVVDALAPGFHLVITHGGVIRHLLRRAGTEQHVAPGEWIDLALSRR